MAAKINSRESHLFRGVLLAFFFRGACTDPFHPVTKQAADTAEPQRRLSAGYEGRRLGGALPGMTANWNQTSPASRESCWVTLAPWDYGLGGWDIQAPRGCALWPFHSLCVKSCHGQGGLSLPHALHGCNLTLAGIWASRAPPLNPRASGLMPRASAGGYSELFFRVFICLFFEMREAVFHSFEIRDKEKKKSKIEPALPPYSFFIRKNSDIWE